MFEPCLTKVIMPNVGLDYEKDEDRDFYFEVMERFSARLMPEGKFLELEAKRAYQELLTSIQNDEMSFKG